jgi:hypothetical protein
VARTVVSYMKRRNQKETVKKQSLVIFARKLAIKRLTAFLKKEKIDG